MPQTSYNDENDGDNNEEKRLTDKCRLKRRQNVLLSIYTISISANSDASFASSYLLHCPMSQQTPAFAYPVYAPSPDTQQTATASSSSSAPQTQSRQAAEDARKDRTLAEFMLMLDEYEPLVRLYSHLSSVRLTVFCQIPNEVTDYYLQRVGFECEDVRLCGKCHSSVTSYSP